jgi:hypothetical protein
MAPEESGSKQCPTCGSWDVRWAIIEDGGLGNWCDNCKKSLKAMEVQEYEGSLVGKIFKVTAITVVSVSIVLFVFWFSVSALVPFHGGNLLGRRNNGIAMEDGRNLSTCFEAYYADHQRYPLSFEEIERTYNFRLLRNVVVRFSVMTEQDYEFVIFHKKGYKDYKISSFSSGWRYREKGEKKWRDL